jgi:hypothetical protein
MAAGSRMVPSWAAVKGERRVSVAKRSEVFIVAIIAVPGACSIL